MPPLRRPSNGRSPLVNQQSQITSFFTKTPSSPSLSPSPTLLKQNPKPNPKSNISPSPTPSPNLRPSPSPTTPSPNQTKSRKPLLVIGPSTPTTTPSPHQTQSRKPLLVSTPTTPNDAAKSYGEEVLNKRIKVYWPLDNSWYEGSVKSYNKITGKHLVQYDDSEEESLDLTKETIQWVEEKSKTFRRLRRVSVVIDDDKDEGEDGSGGDDSTDEDWAKNAAKEEEAIDECSEDMDLEDELDEEDGADSPKPKGGKSSASRKRKVSGEAKSGSGKKTKSGNNLGNGAIKSISPVPAISVETESRKLPHVLDNALREDPSERFAMRETEKFHFLGDGRKDANRRCPGDVNYDPKTLYLPPAFLKGLTGGQRQWWEFKSKHMDKVLFFKMGKFYELYEMDAHIGAKELDLQYMKGDQPHCGFPEKIFSMNVEKLARKGYRVLVVEQTETPEQLELRRKEKGIKDKVVKREVCAVITKGTLTEGEMLSANPDASYLMAVTEGCEMSLNKTEERDFERIFGVCVVDVATSRVVLGQFRDDYECSVLCCLLSELRPVEIIKPAKLLSPETERVLQRHTRSPLVNELVPLLEFWDAEKTVCEVKNVYKRVKDQSISQSLNENLHTINLNAEKNCPGCLPDVLSELVTAGENGTCALSALGGILFYLKQAFLDETLLRFAKFELLPCSRFSDIPQKPYMVLDAAALENLEIFENSRNGDSSGTLYAQLNHCVTAFGKRLLKTWLARPLCLVDSIRERQDAIACLRGDHLSQVLEFRKELSRLPDMERLLARVFASSESNGRNANKVVLYEDAAKKQLQEFISVLRGCELMAQASSSLGSILENVESILLQHLLTPGKSLPDVHLILKHFKESFDWAEANNSGRIIPHEGADKDYDCASKTVEEIELCLTKHLKEQRKILGDPTINYVTVGKDTYLLEVSESLSGRISSDYELRSSKKGFCRYWTPNIKKLLGELTQAQSEKEFKLKTILQRLIGNFCEHHNKWRQLVSATAELDVLISLAIANDYYEGPTCRPTISSKSSLDEVPNINAKSLGHPVLKSDSLGKGTFVPNDITIGGSGHASFILLSGPNMGGKSTILRQVCLAVILAHVGADVPAESFELSPVDRIFVRMGAKDHIMAGQSTFLTELSETASMLSSATCNSLVALDELGRGTSTSDGQAIAESVLEHFVHKVQCRGMFSTHYHRLAIDFQKDPKVSLCHMGCQVGTGAGGVEEVTFLYRMMPGACPKSYGVNVARLAGLPDKVLLRAAAKSREFEAMYGKNAEDKLSSQNWEDKMKVCIQKLINVAENLKSDPTSVGSLIELQHRARMLLQQS